MHAAVEFHARRPGAAVADDVTRAVTMPVSTWRSDAVAHKNSSVSRIADASAVRGREDGAGAGSFDCSWQIDDKWLTLPKNDRDSKLTEIMIQNKKNAVFTKNI